MTFTAIGSRRSVPLALLVAISLAGGCGSSGKNGNAGGDGGSGDGGSTGTGGSTATGGTTGTGGAQGTGGTVGTGGSMSTGGSMGTGGAMDTGGATGTGGATDAGTTSADAGSGSDAGSSGGPLALTSPTVMAGGKFPPANTAPMHHSPELDWTGGPAGVKAWAVILTDLDNNLVHWVIWDIPASAMKLPADINRTMAMPTDPMGSQQKNFQGTPGYFGPNPGGTYHTYRFQLYPVDVSPLPGAAGKSTSQLAGIIRMHMVSAPAVLMAMGKTGGG
jgi:Raf kinase inhibitor-like YbhB/YbcL family protein